MLVLAAVAYALAGEERKAQELSSEVTKRRPEDTLVQSVWVPLVSASCCDPAPAVGFRQR